jgi:hypothetical protein
MQHVFVTNNTLLLCSHLPGVKALGIVEIALETRSVNILQLSHPTCLYTIKGVERNHGRHQPSAFGTH